MPHDGSSHSLRAMAAAATQSTERPPSPAPHPYRLHFTASRILKKYRRFWALASAGTMDTTVRRFGYTLVVQAACYSVLPVLSFTWIPRSRNLWSRSAQTANHIGAASNHCHCYQEYFHFARLAIQGVDAAQRAITSNAINARVPTEEPAHKFNGQP